MCGGWMKVDGVPDLGEPENLVGGLNIQLELLGHHQVKNAMVCPIGPSKILITAPDIYLASDEKDNTTQF